MKLDTLLSESMICNTGQNLKQVCDNQLVMLVFLRHFGCTFCKEAMDEISKKRQEIEANHTKIVFVHMSDFSAGEKYLSEYNLQDTLHISDPECKYYQEFGLVKGNFSQLFGFQNWARAFDTGILKGYGWSNLIGDGFQMPGVFLILNQEIKESYVHKYASDQPDYVELSKCCKV